MDEGSPPPEKGARGDITGESGTSRPRDSLHQCSPSFLHFAGCVFRENISRYSSILPTTGSFAETTSAEHQLHWIFENCKVVRAANGVSTVVEAIKIASSKHDLLWYILSSPRSCSMFIFRFFPAYSRMRMRNIFTSLRQKGQTFSKN